MFNFKDLFFTRPLTPEAPNRMNLVGQRLPPRQLVDFRARENVRAKYRVAARLWAQHQIPMDAALEIAEKAFEQ